MKVLQHSEVQWSVWTDGHIVDIVLIESETGGGRTVDIELTLEETQKLISALKAAELDLMRIREGA